RRKEGRQPRLQRLHVRAEDARLEAFEQVLHREQRLRLARAEPKSGQLVLRRRRIGLLETVAALVAVPGDGRVVAAAHVLDVALEGGERDLQLAQEVAHRNDAALPDQVVDLVEPLAAIHARKIHGATLAPRWLNK